MKLLRAILTMVLMCLSLVFIAPAPTANATSDYDDTFVIGVLEISCGSSEPFPISWAEIERLLDGHNSTFDSAFETAKGNNAYVVYQSFDGASSASYDISVLVSGSLSPHAFFTDYGGGPLLMAPYSMRGSIYCSGVNGNGAPILSTSFNTSMSDRVVGAASGTYNQGPIFSAMPVNYPSGYEGVTVPTLPPTAKYVAMGDSYSSGEGNPAFEGGTDKDGVNECHRSPAAYTHALQDDSSLDLDSLAFVACAGATTKDVLGQADSDDPVGKWDAGWQMDALSTNTEVVTLTIGGNDVGFARFANACAISPCGPGSLVYSDTLDAITNDLGDKLDETYRAIIYAAPNAEIFVIGYPYVTPEDPSNFACVFLQDSVPTVGVNDSEAARDIVDQLNTKISSTVLSIQGDPGINGEKLHFVDPTASGSGFDGHDVCSSTPYFVYPDVATPSHNWMHPNEDGHLAYADVIKEEMS